MRRFVLSLILVLPILVASCKSEQTNPATAGTADNVTGVLGGSGGVMTQAGAGGVTNTTSVSGAGGQPVAGTPKGGSGGAIDASIPTKDSSTAGSGGSAGTGGTAPTTTVDASQAGAGGMIGLNDKQTLIPHASWTCGMPDGIPPPKSGQLVFDADFKVGEIYDVGETQYGHRHQIDITGGKVTGSKLTGDVLSRGLDYQLTLSNGALEVEQINVIRTSDNAIIYFRNCGTAPDGQSEVRMVPDFEAPTTGAHNWLNTAKIVGIRQLDVAKKTLKVSFYDVSSVKAGTDTVKVANPDGVPNQTWDCKEKTGTQGTLVYTEIVGIDMMAGLSFTGKYGTRNIIPITGGTTSGRIVGTVLDGGGDYQLLSGAFVIDARYTVKTNEGDLIIIRNCGAVGSLVPVFETRKDGNFAWLNTGNFHSSDPTIGAGTVTINIFEAN
jgi:hypothetical protein